MHLHTLKVTNVLMPIASRISCSRVRSVRELETAIREFVDVHNEDPEPFVWTRTADQILGSISRYATRALKTLPARLISRTTGTGDYVAGQGGDRQWRG
jgi:hypothetical protein